MDKSCDLVFLKQKGHKFHYPGEAASIIQPIDERVADYIRLHIRERCKTPKRYSMQSCVFHLKENIFGGLRVPPPPPPPQRNKFIPSRKNIRNLILSIRNETRYSKIDQDNIEHLKEQWMKNGDVFFEPYIKQNFEEVHIRISLQGQFHQDFQTF